MKSRKHFNRGAGVFTCVSCKARTRMDSCIDGMCEDCFELASWENSVADGEDPREAAKSAVGYYTNILKRGGKFDFRTELEGAVKELVA